MTASGSGLIEASDCLTTQSNGIITSEPQVSGKSCAPGGCRINKVPSCMRQGHIAALAVRLTPMRKFSRDAYGCCGVERELGSDQSLDRTRAVVCSMRALPAALLPLASVR